MNLRKFRRPDPEINLTSLVDVVFLLVLFFAVSTTFDRAADLSINLPESQAQPAEAVKEPIIVAIDAKGRYHVNGQEVINTQPATLKRAIKLAAGERQSPPLIVSADANTPHQAVVTAMDAARQLGFVRLSIATRTTAERKP